MSIKQVLPGQNVPNEINVIIEIPSQSDPVKYEFDKESELLFVDRFMNTSMRYPCNYGYIPQTLAQDKDPCDVLVLCPFSVMSGAIVRCRPVGVLDMEDEAGPDEKLLAVPVDALTPIYSHIHSIEDISPVEKNAIQHFFAHYKDLELNKWVKIKGWLDYNEACRLILEGIERFKQG
ncbi:MAG: inorganic diphosphatase [Pseudomonadota bacterium]|nr:inorganic diphosphatase [Gammaproteobacteria bacterium]MBU1558432.1 inorganic diphosphatase [Gammaproteobacteria bacterium]MBU1629304.1 inorganic diphosphatase [Gammaproteobacteria bacterium]MBU1926782.1 inorganic diphosphatase [Gammaproteobacteria bacterium]MBU2546044.1 inorganic diphosphatase [Gammaproteobacteria bacterium]